MSFWRLFSGMKRQLRSTGAARAYAEAAGRHSALAAHDGIVELVGVMQRGAGDLEERAERITRALIEEAQRGGSLAWIPALCISYFPMLNRVHTSAACRHVDSDELEQIVLLAFAEVVLAFPLGQRRDRTAMHLRQDTSRLVTRHLDRLDRERIRQEELRAAAREVEGFDAFGGRRIAGRAVDESDREALLECLLDHARACLPNHHVALLDATELVGASLRERVRDAHRDVEASDVTRRYEAIKKARLRARARVRESLERSVQLQQPDVAPACSF